MRGRSRALSVFGVTPLSDTLASEMLHTCQHETMLLFPIDRQVRFQCGLVLPGVRRDGIAPPSETIDLAIAKWYV